MTEGPNVPVVAVKDGAVVADSRDISRAFGKQHKHVLEKIDNLLRDAPELNGPNFRLINVISDLGGAITRSDRAYEMDRTGFSLLAMRFTGSKALRWQIAYAAEFERMEAALRGGSGVIDTLGRDARSAIGGIIKSVTQAELRKAVETALPAIVEPVVDRMVNERLMSGRRRVVEGVSALEIAEMAGFTKGNRPRGLTQFITQRVRRYHEDRGYLPDRSPHGSGDILIYMEKLARRWLREGGLSSIRAYVAQRMGQGRLRLAGDARRIGAGDSKR